MKKTSLILSLITAALLTVTSTSNAVPTMDLSQIDLNQEIVKIDGDWDFYWSKLIDPQNIDSVAPDLTTHFPGVWNKLEINGKKLKPTGYATFHRKLKLPENHPRNFAFKFKRMKTSYLLFINGKLVANRGAPGTSKETTLPNYSPLVANIDIPPTTDEIDIVIQMANYLYPKGGIDASIYFGQRYLIDNMYHKEIYLASFIAGGLFLIGFYHFGLFALRRKDKAPLFFGLFCLCFSIRLLVTGPMTLFVIFPDTTIDTLLSLNYWSVFVGLSFMHLYVYYLFPKEFNKKLYWLSVVAGLVITAIISSTPAMIFARLIIPFELYVLFILFHSLIVITFAFSRKRQGRILFALGLLCILISSVNDILFEMGTFGTTFILPYGIMLFVFAQAVLLSVKFTRAYHEVEDLKEELEDKVIERTVDLEKTTVENRLLVNEITKTLEGERKLIASEIHDNLSATMVAVKKHSSRISNLAAKSGFDEIQNLANTVTEIVSNAYTGARHLVRRLRPEIIDILGLDGALNELISSYNSPSHKCRFECITTFSDNLSEEKTMAIYRIASEAITNIVKHADATSVELKLNQKGKDTVELTISDNGKGFDVDMSNGVGLISMRERALSCNGSFEVNSSISIGTTVRVLFPA